MCDDYSAVTTTITTTTISTITSSTITTTTATNTTTATLVFFLFNLLIFQKGGRVPRRSLKDKPVEECW